jgi:hypothetical protein
MYVYIIYIYIYTIIYIYIILKNIEWVVSIQSPVAFTVEISIGWMGNCLYVRAVSNSIMCLLTTPWVYKVL